MEGENNNMERSGSAISIEEVKGKLRSTYRLLKANIYRLLIAAFIGCACGIGLAITDKPMYTATSTFVLDESNSGAGMSAYAGLASQFGLSLGGSGNGGIFQGDNIIELYKSRSMLEKTLLTAADDNGKHELLIDIYLRTQKQREKWLTNSALASIKFDDPQKFTVRHDSVISSIVKTLNEKYLTIYKPDKKLSIIDVTTTYPDEYFAKAFNQALVENVNQFYIQTKTKKSAHNAAVLKFQADSLRKILNSSLSGVASAIDAAPNANPFNQSLKVPSQKRQIDVQTNAALYTEIVKNLALAEITMRQDAPLIQVIDRPILPLDVKKLGIIKGGVLGAVLAVFLISTILIFRKMLV